MVSAGFRTSRSAQGAANQATAEITAPVSRQKLTMVCSVRLSRSSSRAPKHWEMMTVAPEDRPVKKPMIRLMIMLALPPTAARARVPTN